MRDVPKVNLVIFFKEKMVNQIKQSIVIRIHVRCWLNVGRSVSKGGLMHAENVEKIRVAADQCARGYSNTNHDGRQTFD